MSILITLAFTALGVLAISLTAFFSQRRSRKEMDLLFSEMVRSFKPQWERANFVSERMKAEVEALSVSRNKLQRAIESIKSNSRDIHDRLLSPTLEVDKADNVRFMDFYRWTKTAKELEPTMSRGESTIIVNIINVPFSVEQLRELYQILSEKSTKEGASLESAAPLDLLKPVVYH